jgi:2-oxoglutarate dehydrogenase complex dehydrogenase (E1) component-like enzyme
VKKNELTAKQKEEIEKFGAKTWFVESLFKQYQENPAAVPDQWKNFFQNTAGI